MQYGELAIKYKALNCFLKKNAKTEHSSFNLVMDCTNFFDDNNEDFVLLESNDKKVFVKLFGGYNMDIFLVEMKKTLSLRGNRILFWVGPTAEWYNAAKFQTPFKESLIQKFNKVHSADEEIIHEGELEVLLAPFKLTNQKEDIE